MSCRRWFLQSSAIKSHPSSHHIITFDNSRKINALLVHYTTYCAKLSFDQGCGRKRRLSSRPCHQTRVFWTHQSRNLICFGTIMSYLFRYLCLFFVDCIIAMLQLLLPGCCLQRIMSSSLLHISSMKVRFFAYNNIYHHLLW